MVSDRLLHLASLTILVASTWVATTHPLRRRSTQPPVASAGRPEAEPKCWYGALKHHGLSVKVVSPEGKWICNAQVLATCDGKPARFYEEACGYFENEQPGTFALDVSAPGFQPARLDGVVVRMGRCELDDRDLLVTLQPPPQRGVRGPSGAKAVLHRVERSRTRETSLWRRWW